MATCAHALLAAPVGRNIGITISAQRKYRHQYKGMLQNEKKKANVGDIYKMCNETCEAKATSVSHKKKRSRKRMDQTNYFLGQMQVKAAGTHTNATTSAGCGNHSSGNYIAAALPNFGAKYFL